MHAQNELKSTEKRAFIGMNPKTNC